MTFKMTVEIGVKYIDLCSSLNQYKKGHNDKIYFPTDGHWNSLGHKVVADILYEKISW